jgi:hypothetical protein
VFAGIWTEFKGHRGTKSKPVPGPHQTVQVILATDESLISMWFGISLVLESDIGANFSGLVYQGVARRDGA